MDEKPIEPNEWHGYVPTTEQINQACAAIQAEWSRTEELKRRARSHDAAIPASETPGQTP